MQLLLSRHGALGSQDVRHPRHRGRRQSRHHLAGRYQSRDPNPVGPLLYEDWTDQEMFVKTDPLGNPVDRRHPWNQHTNPRPQRRDFDENYSWVMSPRWFDGTDHLALDTGGGPLARLWSTALAGLVDIGYVKATGNSVRISFPKTALKGPVELGGRFRSTAATPSNATAPGPTSRPTRLPARCTSPRRRWWRSAPGGPRHGSASRCRTRASAAASPRRCAECSATTW